MERLLIQSDSNMHNAGETSLSRFPNWLLRVVDGLHNRMGHIPAIDVECRKASGATKGNYDADFFGNNILDTQKE